MPIVETKSRNMLEKFGGFIEIPTEFALIFTGLSGLEIGGTDELEMLGVDSGLGLLAQALAEKSSLLIEKVDEAMREFLSAEKLRMMFGPAKSALAIPILANLLLSESEAKKTSMTLAERAQFEIQKTSSVFMQIHAFLVEQVTLAQEEETQHLQAKQSIEEISDTQNNSLNRFVDKGKQILSGSVRQIKDRVTASKDKLLHFEQLIPNIRSLAIQNNLLATQSPDLANFDLAKSL